MKRNLLLILLAATFILLGYLRDYLFVNLNYRIYQLYDPEAHYSLPNALLWLKDLSMETLSNLKWIFTAGFTLACGLLTRASLAIFFQNNGHPRLVLAIYLLLLVLAAVFFAGGWITGKADQGYIFSRYLMGFLQSPFITMILIPTLYFYNTTKSTA